MHEEKSILRFLMYTDKTVAQSMRAINERLHVPGTKTRPQIDGWVDKNGQFAISVTTTVRWRFKRKTVMHARAERDSGFTVIRGTVPSGLSRNRQIAVFVILLMIGLVAFSQGSAIMALVVVLAGAGLSIPLQGDYDNSEILLTELQKALRAKFTPPKK